MMSTIPLRSLLLISLLLLTHTVRGFYVMKAPQQQVSRVSSRLSAAALSMTTAPSKATPRARSYSKVRNAININMPDKRRLTDKEEIFAGKLSRIAKELEKKKKAFEKTAQRDISMKEWAETANLSVEELRQTIRLSQLAREKLITHNLRLIDYVVCDIMDKRSTSITGDARLGTILYSGLFQQGVVGLKKAAEYYDGRYKFSFFAVHFIRQECHRYITSESISSHVPHKIMLTGIRIKNMKKRMTEELQRPPTDEELGSKLSFSTHRIHKVLSFIQKKSHVKSLQAALPTNQASENYDSLTYADSLVRSTPIEPQMGEKMLLEYLQSGVLSEEEVQAIMWKFGLNGDHQGRRSLNSALSMRGDKAEKFIDEALQKLISLKPLKEGEELLDQLSSTIGFATSVSHSLLA